MKKIKSTPTRKEAEEAVRVLLSFIGEDVSREGLIETPRRVIDSYIEMSLGYNIDSRKVLSKTFKEIDSYNGPITLKNIYFNSFCEHHILPIIGNVHISYIPDNKIVGISKLVRIVDIFAKRLQVQEKMTVQIADAIFSFLTPKGVIVVVDAEHHCMTVRGVCRNKTDMRTIAALGVFDTNNNLRSEFLNSLSKN